MLITAEKTKKSISRKIGIKKYIAFYTLYKVFIEFTYIVSVTYWYDYLGFHFKPNPAKCILSYVLLWLCVCLLPRKHSIHGRLINLFFCISTIPMLSFFWLANKQVIYTIYAVVFLLIWNAVSKIEGRKLLVKINGSHAETLITIIWVIYVVSTLYLGVLRGGIDFRAFSFDSIYELRGEYETAGGFEAYMSSWCAKAFFPLLTVYYLYTKRWLRVSVCLLCQVYLYLCYGYKAFILAMAFTVFIYCLGKYTSNRAKESNISSLFVFIIGLIPCCVARFNGTLGKIGYAINNVFAMRLLFEPARISFGYFEFFSKNQFLYFSEGLIGKLFGLNYPYDSPVGFIITKYLLGNDWVSNSNTGIVADSYTQLGFVGVVLIAILAGLLIVFLKAVSTHLPIYFIAAALFYPVIMLNDNPLFTNILTNGWIIDVFLLILFNSALRAKDNKKNSKNMEG